LYKQWDKACLRTKRWNFPQPVDSVLGDWDGNREVLEFQECFERRFFQNIWELSNEHEQMSRAFGFCPDEPFEITMSGHTFALLKSRFSLLKF
jgi:hypothetical protein